MPLGRPDTLKSASWLNPLLLLKLTEIEPLVPCCTFAETGLALSEKPEDATTPKLAAEIPGIPAVLTVIGPDAAPAGIMKLMLVAVKLARGAAMVPPP
jgi:hypothetical protein